MPPVRRVARRGRTSPAPSGAAPRARRVLLGAAVTAALTSAALTVPAAADTPEDVGASPCAAPVPLSGVQPGLTGTGLTVVKGTEPQQFHVEVLGVLQDGIGAGRDLIVIEASDLTGHHVVDQGGGIWAGMSGSPVYVDGKLLGAVSYGFSAAPSPIGGVTPAQDMYDLLDPVSGAALRKEAASKERTTVPLSAATRRQINARADAAAPRSLTKLPTPLSVSGLTSARISRLQRDAEKAGLAVIPYAGSSRAASTAPPTARPQAGGNFAAVMSYGDVSAAGVGTTTAVCGDRALAFGHPFNLSGKSSYGANDANSLAIIKDNTFGSFKMANIGPAVGTVDQDRLSGLRANLTQTPDTADVTTTIRNADTGKRRTGATQVADPTFVAAATFYGVLANYDSTFDEIGDGRATSHWTIAGTRAGGKAFSLSRDNRWSDRTDLAPNPAFEVASAVDTLLNNEFEPVTITQVGFDSTVSTQFRQLQITKVAVAPTGGKYTTPSVLRVKPGTTLHVRTTVKAYRTTATKNVYTTIKVPTNARGRFGELTVTGGLDAAADEDSDSSCLLADGACNEPQVTSLDQVIRSLTTAPRNDDLVVRLALESDVSNSVLRAGVTKRVWDTVSGERTIEIQVT